MAQAKGRGLAARATGDLPGCEHLGREKFAEILGMQGGSIKSVVQHGLGDNARLVMVIHPLLESRFYAAVRLIGQLDFMRSPPRAIRVIDEAFV